MANIRTVPRTCEYCHASFLALSGNVSRGHGRYCSTLCKSLSQVVQKLQRTCQICRTTFQARKADSSTREGYSVFCSPACRGVARQNTFQNAELWFWAHVDITPGACHLWTSNTNARGYGTLRALNKFFLAHRMAWMLTHGRIPPGLCVLHRCDTPPCVNVEHLFLGTSDDNNKDKVAKGRQAVLKGIDNGRAKLTENNVRLIRDNPSQLARYALARQFNVAWTTIDHIMKRKLWPHLV